MLTRPPEFTYKRLDAAVKDAAKRAPASSVSARSPRWWGRRRTVARRAPIPVTTGNSLTIAATLETAKLTAKRMAGPTSRAQGDVVGATGAIAPSARGCCRAVKDVCCVHRAARLEPSSAPSSRRCRMQRLDGREHAPWSAVRPDRHRHVGLRAARARREPVQARRRDTRRRVATRHLRKKRPCVRRAGRGERRSPDPGRCSSASTSACAGVAYACLAEAALLAMEGRYECFTLGRDVAPSGQGIYRCSQARFQIAPLRSFGQLLSDELVDGKRARADELNRDPSCSSE